MRYIGRIKTLKGRYGFIKSVIKEIENKPDYDDLLKDFFFHTSNYEKDKKPKVDQAVSFRIGKCKDGRHQAVDVKERNLYFERFLEYYNDLPKLIEQKKYGTGGSYLFVLEDLRYISIICGKITEEKPENLLVKGCFAKVNDPIYKSLLQKSSRNSLLVRKCAEELKRQDLHFEFIALKNNIRKYFRLDSLEEKLGVSF